MRRWKSSSLIGDFTLAVLVTRILSIHADFFWSGYLVLVSGLLVYRYGQLLIDCQCLYVCSWRCNYPERAETGLVVVTQWLSPLTLNALHFLEIILNWLYWKCPYYYDRSCDRSGSTRTHLGTRLFCLIRTIYAIAVMCDAHQRSKPRFRCCCVPTSTFRSRYESCRIGLSSFSGHIEIKTTKYYVTGSDTALKYHHNISGYFCNHNVFGDVIKYWGKKTFFSLANSVCFIHNKM